jgi:hypothetical protein
VSRFIYCNAECHFAQCRHDESLRSVIFYEIVDRPKYLLSRLEGIEEDLSQEKAIIYGKVRSERIMQGTLDEVDGSVQLTTMHYLVYISFF